MNFYRLQKFLSKVGPFPEIQKSIDFGSVDDPRHLANIHGHVSGHVSVPQGILARGAKVVDLLYAGPAGFEAKLLVSRRFADLIKVSNYYGAQFFSTEVISPKGEELPYEVIHPYDYPYEFINVKETKFFFEKSIGGLSIEIKFNSSNELRKKYKELDPPEMVIIKDIVFNESNDLDFFPLRFTQPGAINWFMSDLLKKECEKIPITGIEYDPV